MGTSAGTLVLIAVLMIVLLGGAIARWIGSKHG